MPITQEQFNQFINELPHRPNQFQTQILKSIAFGTGNKLVSALAGSGKTSLLIMTASLLKLMVTTDAMYLAFNVKIKEELNERLPEGFTAINSHSLGMSVLREIQPKVRVDYKKWDNIVRPHLERLGYEAGQLFAEGRKFVNLCSKVMLNNITPTEVDAIVALAEHYSLEVTENIIQAIPACLSEGRKIFENTGSISFDEMLYLPIILNLQPRQHAWVFVDECQDLNTLQLELAIRSCKPDGRMIFVGDKGQAIYGFAGADARSFDNIAQRTNAEILPLNVCYRCPPNHLDLAREIVSQIEAAPGKSPGIIEYQETENLHKLAKAGALVLSRRTAPLISAYFQFIQNRIPALVLGRDLGADLAATLDKVAAMQGFTYGRVVEYLERYEEAQIALLSQKKNAENQIQALTDKIECLSVCVVNFTECSSVKCLKEELQKLFADDKDKDANWKKMVTLCTVHRAKGLEAEEVFIIDFKGMPLEWQGQQLWELEQEMNIKYVALTRSKRRLVIMGKVNEIEDLRSANDSRDESKLLVEVNTPEGTKELVPVLPAVGATWQTVIDTAAAHGTPTGASTTPLEKLREMTIEEDRNQGITPVAVPTPPLRVSRSMQDDLRREQEAKAVTSENPVLTPIEAPKQDALLALVKSLSEPEIDRFIELLQTAKRNKSAPQQLSLL